MKKEEMDELLKELTSEDIKTERQLEIFSLIQKDKEESLKQINDLTNNSAKLQEDFMALKNKKVNEFFEYGSESKKGKEEFEEDNPPKEEEPFNINDILEE